MLPTNYTLLLWYIYNEMSHTNKELSVQCSQLHKSDAEGRSVVVTAWKEDNLFICWRTIPNDGGQDNNTIRQFHFVNMVSRDSYHEI